MKKIMPILSVGLFIFFTTGTSVYAARTEQRFLGRLFQAVQSDGSFWYVNPNDGRRYLIDSESAAIDVIKKNLYLPSKREFRALQKNTPRKDLGKFFINDIDKLIYYADPVKKKLQKIGKLNEPLNSLSHLSMGISDKDLKKIPVNISTREERDQSSAIEELFSCNGKQWRNKCPIGQKPTCPTSGDAYCSSEYLSTANDCISRGLENIGKGANISAEGIFAICTGNNPVNKQTSDYKDVYGFKESYNKQNNSRSLPLIDDPTPYDKNIFDDITSQSRKRNEEVDFKRGVCEKVGGRFLDGQGLIGDSCL